MSFVACTPVGSGQPASSAASTPTLSAPCAYTPTSSMSSRPMMACRERLPMLPVVHWITRSGRSAVLVVMCASSLRVGSVDTVGEYVYPAVVPVPVRPTPAQQEGRPLRWHDRRMQHALPATPSTVHWGYFDPRLEPALVVASGDLVAIETITNHAGDAPDLMMDPQIADVFAGVTDRGPGPHLLTG